MVRSPWIMGSGSAVTCGAIRRGRAARNAFWVGTSLLAFLFLCAVGSAPAAVFVPAAMVSPANGSKLPGSLVTFQWTPGAGVSDYMLCVGAVAAGQCEIYNNVSRNALDEGPAYSHTLAGLPTNGVIFVRLSSLSAATGAWVSVDYTYVAAGAPFTAAMIASPTPGADLNGSAVTFQWNAGTGVAGYGLAVSRAAPGGGDLFSADVGSATSQPVFGLPAD